MKKILALLLAFCLLFLLTACPEPEPDIPTATTKTPMRDIKLYLPNADADGLRTVTTQTDGTAEHIVQLLVEYGALPEDAMALWIQIHDGILLNMNAAFAEALDQLGTTGEFLMLGSLVNTMLRFFDLDSIIITAEGETLETGHNVYDEPMEYFSFD